METYESVLLVKPEVFVFNIPPRASNRGYRLVGFVFTASHFRSSIKKTSEMIVLLELLTGIWQSHHGLVVCV